MQYSQQHNTLSRSLEGHADLNYDGELNCLHLRLVEMGGLALSQCQQALKALLEKDNATAKSAIDKRKELKQLALQADENLVELLGKHCPIAKDLRVIMSFSKAIADLQQISEEAARIALIATTIYADNRTEPPTVQLRDINTMGKLALGFLEKAVLAFDTLNVRDAQSLLLCNEELDAEFESSLRRLTTFVLEDARNVGHVINITLVIKALERLGEHAKNLAEYIIFLVEGIDVRYRLIDD